MMKYKTVVYFFIYAILMIGCNFENKTKSRESNDASFMSVTITPFGTLSDGTKISLYTLTNANGMAISVMNYGGVITAVKTADRDGNFQDIVLGYDSLAEYVKDSPYFGALIGRYGNRIAKGKFSIDGSVYTLVTNNGVNHLHGGNKGFDKVVWDIDTVKTAEGPALKLRRTSKHLEEGYPGNLTAEVLYTLTDNNEIKIDYNAITDKTTIVNLTQHTYFNLTGGKRDILSHQLTLNADKFLPVDKSLIPTAELKDVTNTSFDFRKAEAIGKRINNSDEQLQAGNGYDHCWILNKTFDSLALAATLYDSLSGRMVKVYTTEPGIQFYSGNFLDGSIQGKDHTIYHKNFGLCLETQHFPDSPNVPSFPSVILKPGEMYRSQTVYQFLTK